MGGTISIIHYFPWEIEEHYEAWKPDDDEITEWVQGLIFENPY